MFKGTNFHLDCQSETLNKDANHSIILKSRFTLHQNTPPTSVPASWCPSVMFVRASIVDWYPESFSVHLPRHKLELVFAASRLTVSFALDLFRVDCLGPDFAWGRN